MSMSRVAATAVGFSLLPGIASMANVIDQSQTLAAQTTMRNDQGELAPGVIANFVPFNPALGTLQGVELRTSFVAPNALFAIENLGSEPTTLNGSLGFVHNQLVNGRFLPGMFLGRSLFNQPLAAFDGTLDFSGASTLADASIAGRFSQTITAAGVTLQPAGPPEFAPGFFVPDAELLSQFGDRNGVTITTFVQPDVQIDQNTSTLGHSMPITAQYFMRLDLRYIYTPVPTHGPLLGLAAAGLVAARRRR